MKNPVIEPSGAFTDEQLSKADELLNRLEEQDVDAIVEVATEAEYFAAAIIELAAHELALQENQSSHEYGDCPSSEEFDRFLGCIATYPDSVQMGRHIVRCDKCLAKYNEGKHAAQARWLLSTLEDARAAKKYLDEKFRSALNAAGKAPQTSSVAVPSRTPVERKMLRILSGLGDLSIAGIIKALFGDGIQVQPLSVHAAPGSPNQAIRAQQPGEASTWKMMDDGPNRLRIEIWFQDDEVDGCLELFDSDQKLVRKFEPETRNMVDGQVAVTFLVDRSELSTHAEGGALRFVFGEG